MNQLLELLSKSTLNIKNSFDLKKESETHKVTFIFNVEIKSLDYNMINSAINQVPQLHLLLSQFLIKLTTYLH